jgi:hypothetical protein
MDKKITLGLSLVALLALIGIVSACRFEGQCVGYCDDNQCYLDSHMVWTDAGDGTCTRILAPSDEICNDNIDNDCDGIINEGCITLPVEEICGDHIDNDGDGLVDEGYCQHWNLCHKLESMLDKPIFVWLFQRMCLV